MAVKSTVVLTVESRVNPARSVVNCGFDRGTAASSVVHRGFDREDCRDHRPLWRTVEAVEIALTFVHVIC